MLSTASTSIPQWREAFDEWRGGYNPVTGHYNPKKMRNWDYGSATRTRTARASSAKWCFPTPCRRSIARAWSPPIRRALRTIERCLAGIRAHNRWLKDFCAEDPLRRAGIGLILPNDLDEAIKDIEFIAEGRPARRRAAAADPARLPTG